MSFVEELIKLFVSKEHCCRLFATWAKIGHKFGCHSISDGELFAHQLHFKV
jgi:hypothetical protein